MHALNSRVLKAAALQWLRYERQCMIVSLERPPRPRWHGVPDVIGVNLKRLVTEIEVKMTMADFRANKKKRCMKYRAEGMAECPWKFYFLVPPELVTAAQAELPGDFAGLMTLMTHPKDGRILNSIGNLPLVTVIRNAPAKDTKPLSIRELAAVVKDQSGTLVSLIYIICRQ